MVLYCQFSCLINMRTTEISHWQRGQVLIMATHGTVGEFNSTLEDWVSYIKRLVQYFVANGISEEGYKQRVLPHLQPSGFRQANR